MNLKINTSAGPASCHNFQVGKLSKKRERYSGKPRGRPRKLLAWVVALGEDPAKWAEWFRSVGLPQELRSGKSWFSETVGLPEQELDSIKVFQQGAVPHEERDASGKKIRPTKASLGESLKHYSVTQETDAILSLHEEAAYDGRVELSPPWQRYVDFMLLFADSLPADQSEKVKRLSLRAARSRHWELADAIPAVLGTMAELRARWERGEIWFRSKCSRKGWTIFVEENPGGMPPDEPEDLDETGEPPGHWEGLVWIPDTAGK